MARSPRKNPKRTLYTEDDFDRELKIPIRNKNPEKYRTPFRRDYARVIHSSAFRRLQGKTQLFPGIESDFFRNRLTHSLEVAQIAKSIAIRLNNTEPFFSRSRFHIDTDLVEAAGLTHDLGHPPFGHNGEKALDFRMRQKGGYEGNAQTLRILAKTEKREKGKNTSLFGVTPKKDDGRKGLNLTYRTLAAVLKYDSQIPFEREDNDKIRKGYYRSEAPLVRKIKKAVTGEPGFRKSFKTIECQIMDIADDIAYSTYDLEDAFKANFISPISTLGANELIIQSVAEEVSKSLNTDFSAQEVKLCLRRIFHSILRTNSGPLQLDSPEKEADYIKVLHTASDSLASNGYLRTQFTSELVGRFIKGIKLVEENNDIPALTKIALKSDILEKVEVLKHFSYQYLIMSPRLQVAEYRGYEIVDFIFEVLSNTDRKGFRLLPDDTRALYLDIAVEYRDRVICDFIAGMTDRYAIEFFGRLTSENPETIFKPI